MKITDMMLKTLWAKTKNKENRKEEFVKLFKVEIATISGKEAA